MSNKNQNQNILLVTLANEIDKTKQAQIEQVYEKHQALSSPSEVIAMLKGLKNIRTKKNTRQTLKQIAS